MSTFENYSIIQLENILRGVTYKKEELQQKMAGDMGRKGFYDILPRNFKILPIEKCSLHDIKKLEELAEKSFDITWTIEKKKAEETGTLKVYDAAFKFHSFMDCLTDDEQRIVYEKAEAFSKQRMSSHKIIGCMVDDPDFLGVIL